MPYILSDDMPETMSENHGQTLIITRSKKVSVIKQKIGLH